MINAHAPSWRSFRPWTVALVLATAATGSRSFAQTYEQGFTFRLFDIQEEMDRLYPLIEGQNPNVDEKHALVDYESTASFAGYSNEFIVEISGRLEITSPGDYEFRITSDDGSTLNIEDELVVANDGIHAAISQTGSIDLASGPHEFELRYFENSGGQRLLLEWKPPGSQAFVTIPANAFSTLANVTRVTAPGKKEILRPGSSIRPGNGSPLNSAHPSWTVRQSRPNSFQPKVGALAVRDDGQLFVSTFEPNQFGFPEPSAGGDGKVYMVTNTLLGDPNQMTVTEVASNLSEPLGMKFIDGDLVVTQRLALTRLKDNDADGYYETHETITDGWVSDNYHHFHFGIVERDGFAYSALSTSINRSSDFPGQEARGLNGANPPHRGSLMKTNLTTGEKSFIAGGLRTPNGLLAGPEGTLINCDNQGGWVPTSKIQIIEEGHFYGFYNDTDLTNYNYPTGGAPSDYSDQPVTPPAIWLPHSEVAKSPSELVPLDNGIYAGQYLFGEVTLGGIRRASLEKVNGVWQGCAYRFSQGFEGGVNRLAWASDGSLYVGCIGATSNWSWQGTTYGLQRLEPRTDGTVAFDIKNVRALPDGFEIEYTKPIDPSFAEYPSNFSVVQWTYTPTPDYGGSKQQQSTLFVNDSTLSADGRKVRLQVNGLKEGFVHHITADPPSTTDEVLWSTEAWYTLNAIPENVTDAITGVTLSTQSVQENKPIGTLIGAFDATHQDAGESVTFTLPEGQFDNDFFQIEETNLLTNFPFDFERNALYSILVRAADSAGNFTTVAFDITITDESSEHPASAIGLTSHVLPIPHSSNSQVGRLLITDPDLGDLNTGATLTQEGSGVLLASEAFAYNDGSLIARNGGVGFDGAWTTVTGSTSVTGGFAVQSTASSRIVRLLDTSTGGPLAAYRDNSGNIGQDGTTLYVSYLQQIPQGGLNATGIVEFRRDGNADSSTIFNTGVDTNPAPATYGMRLKRTAALTLAAPSGPTSEMHRLVLKIEFGANNNDTITFYQDPASNGEGSPVGSLSSNDLSFDRLGFGSFQGGELIVGDIRFADNFAAVVPTSTTASHLLELVAGPGDDHNNSFRIVGDNLLANGTLTAGSYSVRIRATDSAGEAYEEMLVVYVGDGLADDDEDGLSNREEVEAGLNPNDASDAALDSDGDGQSNFIEVMGGSSPFDASSLFQSSLQVSPEETSLDFTSQAGHLYFLEKSSDLFDWQSYGSSLTADSSLTRLLLPDLLADDEKGFLRVAAGFQSITPINLLENGLSNWSFVTSDPAEWDYNSTTGVLKHVRSVSSGFIYYPGTFTDFVLRLQFKTTPGTNAGIFTRATPGTSQPWIDGNEIQIDNIDVEGPDRETGSVYRRIAANPGYDPADNVWHSMEIRQVGRSIRVEIDGLVLVDVLDTAAEYPEITWPESGFIGLQDSHHNPLGTTIEYRNLLLYPLP
ncbi:family 16 glycoside hydrolase [Roseibacillus persicicus]|uniref:family 16 glycoside hydrolase n=1 Tax=Roseibacillus persicicus TaxID=454148 RepID=UPI00398A95A4